MAYCEACFDKKKRKQPEQKVKDPVAFREMFIIPHNDKNGCLVLKRFEKGRHSKTYVANFFLPPDYSPNMNLICTCHFMFCVGVWVRGLGELPYTLYTLSLTRWSMNYNTNIDKKSLLLKKSEQKSLRLGPSRYATN